MISSQSRYFSQEVGTHYEFKKLALLLKIAQNYQEEQTNKGPICKKSSVLILIPRLSNT